MRREEVVAVSANVSWRRTVKGVHLSSLQDLWQQEQKLTGEQLDTAKSRLLKRGNFRGSLTRPRGGQLRRRAVLIRDAHCRGQELQEPFDLG